MSILNQNIEDVFSSIDTIDDAIIDTKKTKFTRIIITKGEQKMAYINLKSRIKPELMDSSSQFKVVGITGDYEATSSDDYIGVASEIPVLITLPEGSQGKRIIVKNEMGENFGTITVAGKSGEYIDKAEVFQMFEPFESVTFIFRSGNWFAI